MYEALRKGMPIEELYEMTRINRWFIREMKELVEFEEEIKKFKDKDLPDNLFLKAKEYGFSDKYLSQILGKEEQEIRAKRLGLGKREAFEAVLVSGADGAYYFSTYNAKDSV